MRRSIVTLATATSLLSAAPALAATKAIHDSPVPTYACDQIVADGLPYAMGFNCVASNGAPTKGLISKRFNLQPETMGLFLTCEEGQANRYPGQVWAGRCALQKAH